MADSQWSKPIPEDLRKLVVAADPNPAMLGDLLLAVGEKFHITSKLRIRPLLDSDEPTTVHTWLLAAEEDGYIISDVAPFVEGWYAGRRQ